MLTLTLSNPPSTAVTIEIFSTDGSATGNHVQYQIPYYYDIFFDNWCVLGGDTDNGSGVFSSNLVSISKSNYIQHELLSH